MRCRCGHLCRAKCGLFSYGPADATASPKPHHLLLHLNSNWLSLPFWTLYRLSWKKSSFSYSSERILPWRPFRQMPLILALFIVCLNESWIQMVIIWCQPAQSWVVIMNSQNLSIWQATKNSKITVHCALTKAIMLLLKHKCMLIHLAFT